MKGRENAKQKELRQRKAREDPLVPLPVASRPSKSSLLGMLLSLLLSLRFKKFKDHWFSQFMFPALAIAHTLESTNPQRVERRARPALS